VAETTGISSPAPDVTLPAPAAKAPAPAAPSAPVASASSRVDRPRQATGSIAGSIVDQTGGTMPGVQVTLTNTAGGAPVIVHTDASGQFVARDLSAGEYELVARLPGFATVTNRVKLTAGGNVRGSLTMPLGTLTETITVACGEPSVMRRMRYLNNAIFPIVAAQEAPIRVGGNVRAPAKIRDTRPGCPSAPAVDTIVRLTARIGTNGSVFDIVPVPAATGAEPAQEFVDSAIAAVREWKFTPTLLNGQAVEVGMTIQVTYQRR
jgi:Carboxypeptidase regulatory-like domain/Gram-negative bacterial TonB protein C-terminal